MLFRFEQCQSSMNLATLQRIQAKLGVSLVDILGPDEVRRKGQLRDL
jgi:nicotinamide mononucleotide (NMN) deamidase PncC